MTFLKNKAKDEGGAFEVDAATLTGENVTLSKNKAVSGGGAVNVEQGAVLELTNATFWKNKAKGTGGGVTNEDFSDVTLTNTILDQNKPDNCSGSIGTGGGNLETGDGCGFGVADRTGVGDMGLLKLGDYGGATPTHALAADSPAIDFGVDGACGATDQRGLGRVDVAGVGTGVCDSGAFEFQGP